MCTSQIVVSIGSKMFWFITLFVFTAVLLLLLKLWKVQIFWKNRGIAYEKPIPFFGIMVPFVLGKKFFADLVDDVYKKYPKEKYFGCHIFSEPFLVLRDPDLIKQICVRDFDYFAEHRNLVPEGAEPLVPRTLFSSNVERWRQLRPAMSPAFTSSKMKIMYSIMEECANHYVDFLLKDNSSTLDVELKDMFSRYANDIIATTAFGIKCDSITHRDNEFYRMGLDINNITGLNALKFFLFNAFPKVMEFLKFRMFPKKAMHFFDNVITETIKQREEFGVVRPDIIQLLLEARKREESKNSNFQITYDDVVAQALMFFLGGFETISTSMSFTVYELALNQEIQQKLHKEIDELWNETNGVLSFDAISQMKYFDMIISEGLRKHPPMFFMDRKCIHQYTLEPSSPNKPPLHINPGEQLVIPAYSIHRDPKYFPNPERFDPERFNEENKSSIYPGSYMPFGVGPRNCIGGRFALMEMKTFMFHLLRNFEIVPNRHSQIPLILSKTSVFMMAEKGFRVDLKRRQL